MALFQEFDPTKDLTPEQMAEAQAVLNPRIWCESTLRDPEKPSKTLSLRDCQRSIIAWQPYSIINKQNENVLRQRIKVLRMGRRLGKTVIMAAEALWKACTNANYRVLYIAPFESQCTIFFDMVEKMLAGTPLVPTSFRKKPYYIQFANGSTITGHTANVRSSRKGSSIRGAEGDHIIIDEMDFGMDDVINEVIMPIYIGNNLTTITVASTPTGRRGLFYLWCRDAEKLGMKEFHHTSYESPKWNSESEEFCRRTMSHAQYTHEILADFGEESEGVFRNKDLDGAMKKYDYKSLKYNKDNIYIMGVDWNETYGVSIVIVERSRKTGFFRAFHHEIIEKQELTQLTGVNKIISLHESAIPCNYIYVDHGFGATQVELLKAYGMKNPASRLHEIVKDIDYGGKITIPSTDPGTVYERPAKPFLVHNTQLVFEQGQIFLPEEEDTEFGIIGQARNFRVSKFSSTGLPVYDGKVAGKDNDHSLNALFLALMGFTIEFNQEAARPVVTRIAAVGSFRTPRDMPARESVADENMEKFMQILRLESPNFRQVKDISSLGMVPGAKRAVTSVRPVLRARPPRRSSF